MQGMKKWIIETTEGQLAVGVSARGSGQPVLATALFYSECCVCYWDVTCGATLNLPLKTMSAEMTSSR